MDSQNKQTWTEDFIQKIYLRRQKSKMKHFTILLILTLLQSACEPVDYPTYTIWGGYDVNHTTTEENI